MFDKNGSSTDRLLKQYLLTRIIHSNKIYINFFPSPPCLVQNTTTRLTLLKLSLATSLPRMTLSKNHLRLTQNQTTFRTANLEICISLLLLGSSLLNIWALHTMVHLCSSCHLNKWCHNLGVIRLLIPLYLYHKKKIVRLSGQVFSVIADFQELCW